LLTLFFTKFSFSICLKLSLQTLDIDQFEYEAEDRHINEYVYTCMGVFIYNRLRMRNI